MSVSSRAIDQQTLVAKLADTLSLDAEGNPLSSAVILRYVRSIAGSLAVEVEHPDQNGSRFGDSSAGRLVVSAFKEINQFAETPQESVVLKKRLLATLVDNSVSRQEREYMCQRNRV